MELICPGCKRTISYKNINISTDLAKCDYCNSIHKASELADMKLIEKLDNPPKDSRIIVKRGFDNSVELFLPNKGMTASVIPSLLFTIIWVGFISFWTFIAIKDSVIFALFSIPFWIVGCGMIVGIINSISETQILKINRNILILRKNRPIKPSNIEIPLKDIQTIKMMAIKIGPFSMFENFKLMTKMNKSITTGTKIPAIIVGIKTEYFFEDANDAEQEWATTILDNIFKRIKN